MRVLFVALQVALIAVLALSALVATENSWLLAGVLFAGGALRVFALRALSLGMAWWPKVVWAADALFVAPVATLLVLGLGDAARGSTPSGLGTGVALLVLPAASAALAWKTRASP